MLRGSNGQFRNWHALVEIDIPEIDPLVSG
jgi:hypothetical protein